MIRRNGRSSQRTDHAVELEALEPACCGRSIVAGCRRQRTEHRGECGAVAPDQSFSPPRAFWRRNQPTARRRDEEDNERNAERLLTGPVLCRFLYRALEQSLYIVPDGRMYVSAGDTDRHIDDTPARVEAVFSDLS